MSQSMSTSLYLAACGSAAAGIYSSMTIPPYRLGAIPVMGLLGFLGYTSSGLSLQNSHSTTQNMMAYKCATATSLALSAYSLVRLRTSPHLSVIGLGMIGGANLLTYGKQVYN